MNCTSKSCFLMIVFLMTWAWTACDSESKPSDTSVDEVQVDTPLDLSDVGDVGEEGDVGVDPFTEDCMPVPPGCYDRCLDEEGEEIWTLGVALRTCQVVTGEDGCPELDFTDEVCAGGACIHGDESMPECVAATVCESATCSCGSNSVCSCDQVDCVVTCEGDCFIYMDGENGEFTCDDSADLCKAVCNGGACTTHCGSGGTCRQECNGSGCTLNCGGASECVQVCNGTDCVLECDTASSCTQECNVTPDNCTCNGCT